jgi:signal transduction histidine kinase/ligand-binding sensor domain-containing protein
VVIVSSAFPIDISEVQFEYLTVDDGLSQGTVSDILQDSQGFMWFATRDGLDRYDGQRFIIYHYDRNDPNSLASNWVWCLKEDSEGNLWVGSSSGLNIYYPKNGLMTRVLVDVNGENAFHGGQVYDIEIDTDSTLWLSTSTGLVHYFPATKIFRTYTFNPGKSTALDANTVYSTLITKNNRLFVATNSDPIYEYNRKDNTFTPIAYKIAYQGNNSRKCIQEDNNGQLYINADGSGLHVYNPVTGETKLIDLTKAGLNAKNIITKVLIYSNDEVWIGTDGEGIAVYKPSTGNMLYLTADDRNPSSLKDNAVYKLFEDKHRNIWVGHYLTGISVWKRNKEKFKSYHHSPYNTQTINKEIVTSIFEDSRGRIWIGQDRGGLNLFHEEDQTFEHFRYKKNDPESLSSDAILAIEEDPDGNLLLGTYNGGLMIFDPNTKKVIMTFGERDGLPSNHIWNIFKDSKGRYWMAVFPAGVSYYNPTKRSFVHYTPDTGTLKICTALVMNITEDSKGRIWFCSEGNGLCIIDVEKNTALHYVHDRNNLNSLSGNDVKSVIFIDNYAWIAINGGGLNRLDLKTDSFKTYTTKDGLSTNALMSMLKDKHDNLWISSARGLMKFNTTTGKVESYNKSQGLQGTEFKYNSQFLLSDGRMMFGGMDGLTVFNPDSIRSSSLKPRVVFTDFRVFYKSLVPGTEGSPIKEDINFTDFVKLNYRQSVFTVEFASLDYNSPEKNQYMYKMEGFDDAWTDAGNRNFATYTNLDAGKYTFLLKGSNSDGVWNEETVSLRIIILPPWWKTWLFKIFIIVFILGITLGYYYYRINLLKEQKRILEDLVSIRTQEVEEKNAVLMNQAEELNESNVALEKRQQFIEEQAEELLAQNEYLQVANEQSLKEQAMIKQQAQDLEETNLKLTVLNATKDKLFSIIAHDLKNPFSSILSFSEILLKKFKDLAEDKKLKFIHAIFDSSHKVYDLLENLLQWARSQTGNIQYMPEAFNLDEVIDANYDLVKNMLDEKEITITKGSTDNIIVFADRNMINTVIRNLLSNAIKYTEKGTISVDIVLNGDYAEVNVTDSGTGISEAKMATLFEIEQNKSSAGTRNEKGSGLGLLICRDFVQINKGEITVKSVAGKGTTFTFTVPLKP